MDVGEFDFDLPSELIAQDPAAERGASRLLCLGRDSGAVTHTSFAALPDLLRGGDLLVVNNTRVFPARLLGRRVPTGGAVECLLVAHARAETTPAQASEQVWEALMHPGQKLAPGAEVIFEGECTVHGEVLERRFHGRRLIRLWTDDGRSIEEAVDAIGHVPLPPYIKRQAGSDDRGRYQTLFARERGSIAAPTAGLHFSPALMDALGRHGIQTVEITLHVGYGTFQPVRVDRVEDHRLEAERYEIGEAVAAEINGALDSQRRVIAVGTTTTRALEASARAPAGRVVSGAGSTDLFIFPGFDFRVVRGLLTNFHLPRSSLVMLVSAFGGRETVMAAYAAAIAEGYRFYSYGDAMLIL